MFECQSERTMCIIQCPHQCIDRNWNIMFQFGDIRNRSKWLVSELYFLKNWILSEEFANNCWDKKFGEVCEEDFEWYGWLCGHSPRGCCQLNWMIELRAHSIRDSCHGLWFSHHQLRMQQNSISFRIVWCHLHSQTPLKFGVTGTFLFGVMREYPAFPGLYRSLVWISILLSLFFVFWFDLGCILLSSLLDIGAIWSVSDFIGRLLFDAWPLLYTLL
jgi:hypothetical protein